MKYQIIDFIWTVKEIISFPGPKVVIFVIYFICMHLQFSR